MIFNAVIFDKDGLMVETEKLSYEIWTDIMISRGYTTDKDMFIQLLGRNAVDEEVILKKIFGEDFPFLELYNERKNKIEKHIARNGIALKKGLIPLLNYLDKNHIKKAVATSTFRVPGEQVLASAGLINNFSTIVYGDDVKTGKPEPDIFLEAARRLDVLPSECIVLEDSEAGIQAAVSAGMIPVMIPDLKQPTEDVKKITYQIFSSLNEVIPFLEEHLNDTIKAGLD